MFDFDMRNFFMKPYNEKIDFDDLFMYNNMVMENFINVFITDIEKYKNVKTYKYGGLDIKIKIRDNTSIESDIIMSFDVGTHTIINVIQIKPLKYGYIIYEMDVVKNV